MADSGNELPPDSLIVEKDSLAYWQGVSSDNNGMLGGFPFLHKTDIQGSRSFLAKLGIGLQNDRRRVTNALEAGAGIGRVTEGLILDIAEEVDIIEPVTKFTAELRKKPGVRTVFDVGIDGWRPRDGDKYDLIWTQWCLPYLTDEQVVRYLERCKTVLEPGGVIVVKENLSSGVKDIYDEEDSSVTRGDDKFLALFKQAGMRVVKMNLQRGFDAISPQQLFPVKMYGLKPM